MIGPAEYLRGAQFDGQGETTINTERFCRMAKEASFKAGDHVVYPTHGVGVVKGIETENIAGHELQLIVVTFERDRMTLRVPKDKMKSSGLRRLSTRKVIESAMTTLKGRAKVKRTMWSRRAQEYEAKINSGDPVSIAEVVRSVVQRTPDLRGGARAPGERSRRGREHRHGEGDGEAGNRPHRLNSTEFRGPLQWRRGPVP